MTMKTILVAPSGGTASDGALEIACRLARRHEAQLEGFHVKVDPTQILTLAAGGYDMPVAGEWIDRLIADTDELAKKTKSRFEEVVKQHELGLAALPHAKLSALWNEEVGYPPILVSRRARFFDLVVLGRSERVVERPHSDTIEETLIHSGRAVLLAPAKPPVTIDETIAIGWNGSPEAVHALTAALPILKKARSVLVITVSEEEAGPLGLLGYLERHGISAKHRHVLPVKGVGSGEQILAQARDAAADLLVMGAYGHRPWREVLFGGATRQVVERSLLPVLLAH
jgi:nucleotide-binding universal stress UspA family protein